MTIAGEWSVCCCCTYCLPNCVSVLNFSFPDLISVLGVSIQNVGIVGRQVLTTMNQYQEEISCGDCNWMLLLALIHSNSSQQLVAMGTGKERNNILE